MPIKDGQGVFYIQNNKSQITNPKQLTMTKIQKFKRFGHWVFEFEIYL